MSDEEISQIMKIDLTKAKELISSSAPRGEKKKLVAEFEQKLFRAEALKHKKEKLTVRKIK